ncbi:hypothetical protein CSB45_11510 [candidate division KSB3 bacterium]|uniref:Uncharacterized protein n=1 Tax=candidate division KSB3 bacterium TaxID=2044937 RepID=A0A2G6E3Z4_9BACT|nr:MAG: hypothetical protein CSB45_11510 [candidate division KSB3 bacterium]PIE28938.1 MAG: hypothetical protein CSA57_11555 [candidate division KSB3 bacterium]
MNIHIFRIIPYLLELGRSVGQKFSLWRFAIPQKNSTDRQLIHCWHAQGLSSKFSPFSALVDMIDARRCGADSHKKLSAFSASICKPNAVPTLRCVEYLLTFFSSAGTKSFQTCILLMVRTMQNERGTQYAAYPQDRETQRLEKSAGRAFFVCFVLLCFRQ